MFNVWEFNIGIMWDLCSSLACRRTLLFFVLLLFAAGQRAREEGSAWRFQPAAQSTPQHLQHEHGPALPAGALGGQQPDQAEGHSQGVYTAQHCLLMHVPATLQLREGRPVLNCTKT